MERGEIFQTVTQSNGMTWPELGCHFDLPARGAFFSPFNTERALQVEAR